MTNRREGKVVSIRPYDGASEIDAVVINLGRDHGVTEGDKFLIYRYGEEVKDPDTGESLGKVEIVLGRGVVKHIQQSMTTLVPRTKKRSITKINPGISGLPGLMGTPFGKSEVIEQTEEPEPFDPIYVGDLVRVL